MNETEIKALIDGVSIATVTATVMSWLPPIAASLTVVWTLIRIYESPTVQALITRLRAWFKR